jgi:DNA repair and recombination protein RAD52
MNEKDKSIVQNSLFGSVEYEQNELMFLKKFLETKLDNKDVATRKGPGGGDVHYIETWRAIEIANEAFGFNGWSSSIIELTMDFVTFKNNKKV